MNNVELTIKPLTFSEIREFAKMCDNGQPCLYDVEIVGRISRIQKKQKTLKTKVKEYYSITVRSLQDPKDYFIIHTDKDGLKEGDVIYARGTLFKINDFAFLSASVIKTIDF